MKEIVSLHGSLKHETVFETGLFKNRFKGVSHFCETNENLINSHVSLFLKRHETIRENLVISHVSPFHDSTPYGGTPACALPGIYPRMQPVKIDSTR
jgi:hypothetical protein